MQTIYHPRGPRANSPLIRVSLKQTGPHSFGQQVGSFSLLQTSNSRQVLQEFWLASVRDELKLSPLGCLFARADLQSASRASLQHDKQTRDKPPGNVELSKCSHRQLASGPSKLAPFTCFVCHWGPLSLPTGSAVVGTTRAYGRVCNLTGCGTYKLARRKCPIGVMWPSNQSGLACLD